MAPYGSIFRPGLFKDSVYIVSGGGSGIGRCIAHELTSLGATVAILGRNPEKLKVVSGEIARAGGGCSIHVCDIREEDTVVETVRCILRQHSRIDGLVNNAGGQYYSPLASIKAKGFDAVVRNNLTGGFLLSRECYNQYMSSNGGAIVNILADMWMGMPGMGHSGAARAGMLNLTETASLEWAPVRVNAVAPGWIESSGMRQYPADVQEQIKQLPRIVSANRVGTESEVSAAVTFLLSPAGAFISGSCLRVDGAAPNAKRVWGPTIGNGKATIAFNAHTNG